MTSYAKPVKGKMLVVGLICASAFAIAALFATQAPAFAATAPNDGHQLTASALTQQSSEMQTFATRASNGRESLVDIYVNSSYSNYDITGDGKADTIKVKTLGTMAPGTYSGQPTHYDGLAIYVNGREALKLTKKAFNTSHDGYALQLATLNNGKVFLYVRSKWYNQLDTTNRLYRYKSGKLVLAKDLIKIADSRDGLKSDGTIARSYGLRGPNGITVSGNRIVAKGMLANSLVGSGAFDINLLYKKGKLILSPRTSSLDISSYTHPSTQTLTAKRSIAAYKSTTGSKKAFTIKKGQKVTIKKISIRNKNPRVQVKVGKKTGWIKLIRDVSGLWSYNSSTHRFGQKYFENMMPVG